MNAYDEIWKAIGHLRAAKTNLAHARQATPPPSPALADLLRLEARRLLKEERDLIQLSEQTSQA